MVIKRGHSYILRYEKREARQKLPGFLGGSGSHALQRRPDPKANITNYFNKQKY
jgi:hypothetical protein